MQASPDLVVFQPREAQKDKAVLQRGNLEDVPVEVQQIILHQMPDFSSLQALISASPTYLKAYLGQRHSIVSDILHRSIHPDVLLDAMAIVDALKLPRNYDDYVPNLKNFVKQYRTTKASLDVESEPLEPSTIDDLWEFHLLILDVTKDFCDYMLSTHPVTGQSLNHYTSLSPNEARRIHRALYRYELFTRLFNKPDFYLEEDRARDRRPGLSRLALQRNSIRSLDSQDKAWLFFPLFKAWEVEEIACVRDYITHRYDEPYRLCKSELQELVMRGNWGPGNSPPSLPFEYDGDEACLDHYLSLGLGFLHTFIRASRADQLTLLRENLSNSCSTLSEALEEECPVWDDPMYDAWIRKDTLAFHKDSDKDGPNAAWPWSTGNKVELCYYQPDRAGLRKWGYVMWDKERLDQWAVLQKDPHDFYQANGPV